MAETNYETAQALLGQVEQIDPTNPSSAVAALYGIGYALLAVVDELKAQQPAGSEE